MIRFKQYLREFAVQSTSDYVFDTTSGNSSSLKIPISGPMFKRIWPDTIRATVFHTTDLAGLERLGKLEGGKKSISAFFSMMSRYMETGVASGGDVHVVVEMDADVLVSARDDIWSQVDKTGRRWVELSWFANAQLGGTGPKFNKVEKDLNTLIKDLVVKHLTPILGKNEVKREHEYELWSNMKIHLKGDGQKLRLIIKDYFDGMEKVIADSFKTNEYATKISIDSNEELNQIFEDLKNDGYKPILQSDRDVLITDGADYKVCNLILKSNYTSEDIYNFVEIGESLAANFGLNLGDSINIVSPLDFNMYINSVPSSWFVIGNIYTSPLIDIESNNIYISSESKYSNKIQASMYIILNEDLRNIYREHLSSKYSDIAITDWISDNNDLFSAIRLEEF